MRDTKLGSSEKKLRELNKEARRQGKVRHKTEREAYLKKTKQETLGG